MNLKNMTEIFSLKNLHKHLDWMAYTGVLLLLIGFLFNRVTNNLGSILIGVYTVIKLKDILPLFSKPWLISFILISMIPLISDIIVGGFGFYQERGVMKLLLILFPAFIFCMKPDDKKINLFMWFFIILMFASSAYSIFQYANSYSDMFITYKESRVVSTLSLGDHIRISWATLISCIFALYILLKSSGLKKTILIVYIIFQVAFLHILGSKTGLISLYLTVLILLVYSLYGAKKWYLLIILPIMALLPLLAYKTIPSFQQRINFIKYDFDHYIKGEYKEGLSDAVRYYSLLAGKDIISEHVWIGTGFSRLQSFTNIWYKKNIPELKEENYFLPSSQIIIYWASGGIIGLLIFLYHIFYPFFDRILRKNMWFMAFFIPAIVSFTYETHLEGQLPLFIYGFFCSFFWYLAYYDKNKVDNLLN